MKAIQLISQDLFDKVRSRFQNLEMGDEIGAVTIDPAEARFFDFDFINEGVNLGRVSISLNDTGSLKVYYSQGITENQDDLARKMWYNFLKEMRLFSMRRLLRFDTRDIAKTHLDKNDFQHLAATQGPKEEPDMNTMNESRWNHKSSSKTSRAVQGKTEVIVRHANKVAETYPGARSQRQNIKAIFIQNHEGERFKYPFIHTAGAFAMAQHIDHGGVPHDSAGKAIIKMSENIAQLGEFQRHIQRSALHDDAHGIAERAIGHMHELKARVAALGKRHHYQAWKEDFDNSGMEPPTEDEMVLDAVTLEDYKSKFTQTNFQEELVGFFPLLHSIMREANTVDLEEYVNESNEETEEGYNPNSAGVRFEQFEEWAESTEQGTLTPDQLNNLKAAIEALPQGDQGPELDVTAADAFFSNPDLGLIELPNFDEFEQSLHAEQGRSEEIQATPIQLFQSWAKENNPALLSALGMESGEAAAPAPEAPPVAPEAPPVAPEQPVAEGSKGSMVQEVAKIVKSFYNASNESVGPFRGEEGIVIDVEKQISEKFGEKEGKQAGEMARAFMEKLTQQWHRKHGKVANGHQDDGLARMMELVGNIKQKVEGMGQPEMEKEGMMDKAKAFGKKVLDRVAPDDDELLRRLQKDSGVPAHAQHGKPPMATPNRGQQPRENAELESIMKLAGVGEGSGPKEKQKTPYKDINGPGYKAAADKQMSKMAATKAAEPGKKLADKISSKK